MTTKELIKILELYGDVQKLTIEVNENKEKFKVILEMWKGRSK